MNKKGELIWLGVFVSVMVICSLLYSVHLMVVSIKFKTNDCVIKIAEDYCEEVGFYYFRVAWDFPPYFVCKEDLRGKEYKEFLFLDEELERCKK